MRSILAKIGDFVKRYQDAFWTAGCCLLIAWSAYNLGILRAQKGAQPLQNQALFEVREGIDPSGGGGARAPQQTPDHSDPRVVVSKTSSAKKYHHAWCTSGNRIKEENRVWYPSAAAAEQAGYTLAGNCTP